MNNDIPKIYDMLQEIAWHFGAHGLNGECCGDLSFVEYMALKNAYEKSRLTVQELGNALNFSKSGATRIINRLEKKGYAIREDSPDDGRVCCISLTEKGAAAMTEIVGKYTNYLEDALKQTEQQKIVQIRDTLALLLSVIQDKILD